MDSAQEHDEPQQHTEKAANALFFARCPPTLPYEELLQLFSKYGEVKELKLYRRWAKAKNSKGCGTVVFSDNACAQTAMDTLNGKHEWPESEAKMVVEWCAPEKLQVKSTATETSAAGTKAAVKPKSAAKSKSQPLLKLHSGDQVTSQQLLRDTWRHSLHDGYSSGSDWDSPVPAHCVPMVAGMMVNAPAGTLCNNHFGQGASHPLLQLTNNWSSAPNALLHNLVPPTSDFLDQDEMTATLSNLQNNHISSRNSSFTSLWGCNSSPDLQQCTSGPLQLLHDADDIWLQQHAAFAAVAANTGLTSTRSSASGGTSAVYGGTSLCSLMDDVSLCGSAEYACDSVTGSGGSARPDAGTLLPPVGATALSLLQLQQMEQQQQHALMLAKFTAATSSSPLPLLPQQYMAMAAGTAPAGTAVHPAAAAAPKIEEVRVDLNPHSLTVIATSIDAVAKVSGAHVTIDASRGGLQLQVNGLADQVESACNCLRYVLSMGGVEGSLAGVSDAPAIAATDRC